jgi:Spy/CpxP family protein refolding chaperone
MVLLAAALPALAGESHSAYVGLEGRQVKALSPEREKGLAEGAGLGYAMAAELNGHAGPKHVLDLATELGLSSEQRTRVAASFEKMKSEAVSLGSEILAAEGELDRRFAHRHLDEVKLAELTARLGGLEGRLRCVHLRAHLETDAILTAEQRARYSALRGYREGAAEIPAGHFHGG